MVKTPEEYEWSSYKLYIGKKKPPEWLYRDFILGYFGKKVSIAQKEYHKFVTAIVNKKYDNPLDEVVSSTLLGSPDFITFIKDKFLLGKKPDKDLPALKELVDKSSLKDIFDKVESVFGKEAALSRNIKMFLCRKYTDEKLKNIGAYFGVGESGVSQTCRRVKDKIRKDKKLERKISKIEKKIKV
ncbi:MAG: hypothetical protein U9R02_09085 [Thermodesulfobacteriota bacterium]|nr:hypothetical protein [Thermodesulfobacteriota bacterium]